MPKNYYDILGISSPAMRKHFINTDERLEDISKELINLNYKIRDIRTGMGMISTITQITVEDLNATTCSDLMKMAQKDTIRLLKTVDSVHATTHILTLTEFSTGHTNLDSPDYAEKLEKTCTRFRFENDYYVFDYYKATDNSNYATSEEWIKDKKAIDLMIPLDAFIHNESTNLYELTYEDERISGNYFNHLYAITVPVYDTKGNIANQFYCEIKNAFDITNNDNYVAGIGATKDSGVNISLSYKMYNTLINAEKNQQYIILKVV